ncbi:MAG: dephospho-CoA kinase [Bacteroidales bacterium]|nr:dephospho-CoA kinase [Bacteroidales bacterium]
MLNIGLSGGIGSGKSLICKIFEMNGVPVYYTDNRAKFLIENSSKIKNTLIGAFGIDIYNNNGLNKEKLSELLFNNNQNRIVINSIVHPEVWKDQEIWQASQKNCRYVITESALLFDTGYYKKFDYTICVCSPIETRIVRLLQRDVLSNEVEIIKKIESQSTDDFKRGLANFIIENNEKVSTLEQIYSLHKHLITI